MVTSGETGASGRDRPSAATNATLLDEVIPLIREVGYQAFSVEALAARTQVGEAVIRRDWGSKEGVAVGAVDRLVANIPIPDLGSLTADLTAALSSDAALHSDPQTPTLLSSIVAEMTRDPHMAATVRGGFIRSREETLAIVLHQAIARGELPSDLDIGLAVQLCAGPMLYRTLVSGEPTDAAVVTRLVNLLIQGLSGR